MIQGPPLLHKYFTRETEEEVSNYDGVSATVRNQFLCRFRDHVYSCLVYSFKHESTFLVHKVYSEFLRTLKI